MTDLRMLDSMIVERNKASGSWILTRLDLENIEVRTLEDFEEMIEEYIREHPGLNVMYQYNQVLDHQVISWWWG